MTINYKLSAKTDGNGLSQILVRVCNGRDFRVQGKTRIYISPKDWNTSSGEVRKTSKIEKTEKRLALEQTRSQLNRLREFLCNSIIETKGLEHLVDKSEKQEWIDYTIALFYDPSVKLTKEKNITFNDFTDIYVQVRSKEENWRPAPKKVNQKREWLGDVYKFLCAVKTQVNLMNPHLLMSDINEKTLDEYQNYLINKGYKNATIQNHITYFRTILVWAYDRGYLPNGARIKDHRTPHLVIGEPVAYRFLLWDEFLTLLHYDLGNNIDEEITRDRFCFSCLTSLRYSDVQKLQRSNFDSQESPTYFTMICQKTKKRLTIYLHPDAQKLVKKYMEIDTPNGLLFPPRSKTTMNHHLQKLARQLGFDRMVSHQVFKGQEDINITQPFYEVIGTHSGRQTFVMHALDMGWSELEIRQYTGHCNYETLKPYLAVRDEVSRSRIMHNF